MHWFSKASHLSKEVGFLREFSHWRFAGAKAFMNQKLEGWGWVWGSNWKLTTCFLTQKNKPYSLLQEKPCTLGGAGDQPLC